MVEVFTLVAEANPANISATHFRGSVAHFAVQLLVVNGNDRTPLSSAVEENLDHPEFIDVVA